MSKELVQCLKKVKMQFIYVIGWCSLLLLWFNFLFLHHGLHSTINAMKVIILWAIILFIFCLLWNSFNLRYSISHIGSNSNFIRIKVKDWTWAELTFDANDNVTTRRERLMIICKYKEYNLSSSKRHSYSALLIRDGHIKEAIGFLRQILLDPYIGQLARKIAESELNLLFMEGTIMNSLKGCSVTINHANDSDKQFQMSILGYNKKQVDEFLNELMTYCLNLEEENKELKNDLSNYGKDTQHKHSSDLTNAKWEEKEYSLLLGLILQADVLDYKGNVICEKNSIITSQLIENLISKGLYGELVSAADQSKGVERNAI